LGACLNVQEENSCQEVFEGKCKSSCDNSEEEISASCGLSPGFCCVPKEKKSGSMVWLWILLIFLIVLLVLAIIFRDKLRLWWFKFKGKFSSKPVTSKTGPGPPPGGSFVGGFRPMPPRYPQQRSMQPIRRQISQRDSGKEREMDDTFKKLREMSK